MISNPISRYWRGRKEMGIMEFKNNEMCKIREKSHKNGRVVVGGSVAGKEGTVEVRRKKKNRNIM
jgi:hypothetical protein